MQHRDRISLKKINDEIDIALKLLGNTGCDEFLTNELLKRALCMTVINVGELVKNLTDDFRSQYRHIPWKQIAGFRDIAAHKYATLDMSDVYNSVKYDFPELKENIANILSES